jgi:hypothetical protein
MVQLTKTHPTTPGKLTLEQHLVAGMSDSDPPLHP